MQQRTPWTEVVLYYVLWAISTFLILVDIWAVRLGVMSLASIIVHSVPTQMPQDPGYTLGAIDIFLWLILIAAGLSMTILIEYRLRRAWDTMSPTSGAPEDGGPKRMVRTALKTWAWEAGVAILSLVVRLVAATA